ncbi:DUF2867 domain-containing protein [Paracoccus sp. (in: a-proteobacteria)]|jgi:hypothetical protein|uniref:DUF2867 domain-containing protein n=1 Tax=Paracoccus sp. TaxID=267 RepID=UPI0035B2E67D
MSAHVVADPPPQLLAAPEALDFHDRQAVTLSRPVTPLQAWNMVRSQPRPVLRLAFRIRDAISARFGVRRIGGFTLQPVAHVRAGDMLDFFLVEHAAPDMLVLTARDRHLDVMICISTRGAELAITASVVTHNRFGRAYMRVVGPAHRLIVRGMLRRLRRQMGA